MAVVDLFPPSSRLPLERDDVSRVFFGRVVERAGEVGVTLAEVEAAAGLARGSLRQKRLMGGCPRLDIAYRIAVALDTTLDDLLDPNSPIGTNHHYPED